MKFGDVVRNRQSGVYATVEYSTFGISLHWWDEEHKALGKTLGEPRSYWQKDWEVVDLPEGYEIMEYGGIIKIKDSNRKGD
jgi:hypothetical protein